MHLFLAWLRWALAAIIAGIFVWYLQFKFTGHPGSVSLFTTLTDWLGAHGYEKAMRIGTGSMELLASVLVFVPATRGLGALLGLGIMSGAIFFHLVSPLGIDPYGDGGRLFKEACLVWVSSLTLAVLERRQLIDFAERYLPFLPIPAALRA